MRHYVKLQPSTGLRYGDASKIARIHKLSAQHVIECARLKGARRTPNAALLETIARYRAAARNGGGQ